MLATHPRTRRSSNHLAEFTRKLDALKSEYTKLDETLKKETSLELELKTADEHDARAREHIGGLKQSLRGRQLTSDGLKLVSATIEQRLRAAQARQFQVFPKMGIAPA